MLHSSICSESRLAEGKDTRQDRFSLERMSSTGYDQFSDSESPNLNRSPSPLHMPNRSNRRIYIMFGVLALFLFLLTISVGVKFSQLNQQVSEMLITMQVVDASMKNSLKGSLNAESTVPLPVRGSCQQDWLFYKNKCYFISRVKKNWHNAEKDCIQRSAHLVVTNDEAELEFVSQIADPYVSYWIGLVERNEEGNWSWVDGTDFKSTEHFWDEGQPDDWEVRVNGEDCGQIHALQPNVDITSLKLWNDGECTLNFKYICESNP